MHLVFTLFLDIGRVDADLLVVLFEDGKVLAGLRELAFLHTFTDIPVDEGTLRVHEVELVVWDDRKRSALVDNNLIITYRGGSTRKRWQLCYNSNNLWAIGAKIQDRIQTLKAYKGYE